MAVDVDHRELRARHEIFVGDEHGVRVVVEDARRLELGCTPLAGPDLGGPGTALRKGLGPLPAWSLGLALGLGLRLLGRLGTAQSCRSAGDGPNDDDMYGAHDESSDMEKS